MNSLESNPKKRIQFDGINFEDRIQVRKELYKGKGAKPDIIAEHAMEAKAKREEHLERIRKLEIVKEKRSPKKDKVSSTEAFLLSPESKPETYPEVY